MQAMPKETPCEGEPVTVHHVHKAPNGCTETDCGEINTYTKMLTVSDDWAMVTCEACRAKKPQEHPGLALPCPWCDYTPATTCVNGYWTIKCMNGNCKVHAETTNHPTHYTAVEMWNSAGRKEAAERATLQQSIAWLTKDLCASNDKNIEKQTRINRLEKEKAELMEKLRGTQRLAEGEPPTLTRMRNEIRALIQEELARTSPAQKPAQITIGLDTFLFNKEQITGFIDQLNNALKDT